MKSAWHKTFVLILSAGYLSVVTFGHCFHNHGQGDRGDCGYAACHVAGDGHHHDAGALGHHYPCCPHPPDGVAAFSLPASENLLADHHCAVCNFFFHHCPTIDVAEAPATGRAVQQVAKAANPVASAEQAGPQQPRAPPLFA